jgi:hypothetical protein
MGDRRARNLLLGGLCLAALASAAGVAYLQRVELFVHWYWHVAPGDLFFDRGLAASLLLVHWGAPGAAEALVAGLRGPENERLFDFLWEEHTPPSLLPALQRLAEEQPECYAARVKWLAAQIRRQARAGGGSASPR